MLPKYEREVFLSDTISLERFSHAYTDHMVKWFSDPDIMYFMYPGDEEVSTEKIRDWVEKITGSPNKHYFIIESNQMPIGMISVKQMDNLPTIGEISIAIGEKEFQEKGIGKKALSRLLDYGWNTLKLTDMFAIIKPDNIRSKKLFTRAGFYKTDVTIEGMEMYMLSQPASVADASTM